MELTIADGIELDIGNKIEVTVGFETQENPDFIQQSDGTFVCNMKGDSYGKIFIINKDGKLKLEKNSVDTMKT